MTATVYRKPGHCLGCNRDAIVESRSTHAERVLCDQCAAKPHRRPTASIADLAAEVTKIAKANGHAPATGGRKLTLTPASEIKSSRVRWAWQGWVPLGALSVVAGEAGLGKSTLTGAHLAALITRGELAGELHGKPADTLIVSAEDDWSSVIKPRLMAAGANLDRVHRVNVTDDDGAGTFTLPDDVRRLERALDGLAQTGRRVAMVTVDPIGAFLSGGVDPHKDASVRRALTPLAQLAMDRGIAIVCVAHLTKDQSAKLLSRVSGSVAFGAAPQSVIGFARDPEDPNGEQGADRIIVHAKSNVGRYATSLTARVESRDVDTDDGERADTALLVITGESSIGVDDLQRGRDDDGPDAEEAIGHALFAGPRRSSEVKADVAAEVGCAKKTVERAAVRMRERGALTIEKAGFPPTSTWALVNGDAPLGTQHHSLSIPNREPAIDTGVSASGPSIGDTPGVVVPNGSGHESDVDRAEQLAARHADLFGGES